MAEKSRIREPKQRRAIEKKTAILQASYALFCEKGYHQTNTAEIARRAGVSTGIVYSYFADKHDILMAIVQQYIAQLEEALQDTLAMLPEKQSLAQIFATVIHVVRASHTMRPQAHELFLALAVTDGALRTLFDELEVRMLAAAEEACRRAGIVRPLMQERLRLAYSLIEQLCHDAVRLGAEDAQFAEMQKIALAALVGIFAETEEKEAGRCEW